MEKERDGSQRTQERAHGRKHCSFSKRPERGSKGVRLKIMAGSILVFLEHSAGKILKASLAAISAAGELKTAWQKTAW